MRSNAFVTFVTQLLTASQSLKFFNLNPEKTNNFFKLYRHKTPMCGDLALETVTFFEALTIIMLGEQRHHATEIIGTTYLIYIRRRNCA